MSSIQANASQLSLPSPAPSDESVLASSDPDETDDLGAPDPAVTEQSGPLVDALLNAADDARQIIRLLQCAVCHGILQQPTTLPCGYSICGGCLPEAHPRANISWPATASRLQGFDCPISSCGKEHAIADCAPDVTLRKVLTTIKTTIASYQSSSELPEYSTHVVVQEQWTVAGLPSLEERSQESRVLSGGKILATYALAELGRLEYNNEVSYSPVGAGEDDVRTHDDEIFLKVKESARTEMDCQVCFALYLDPMTTTCGHTYCRTCIHRMLIHSNLCPICRRPISIQAQADPRVAPSNERLVSMINGFWADLVALRSQAHRLEQQANYGGFDIPLFVCTLSFPSMPLFLHVFEPRYRLMIRRAMEGDRTFGMVLGCPGSSPDEPEFMELGVLLRIVNIEFFPDGRSLLETVGVSRFRVTQHGLLDGYYVANIEKLDDISLADEEALEALELSHASNGIVMGEPSPVLDASEPEPSSIDQVVPTPVSDPETMSTQDLANFGVAFVRKMQAESVYWLATRMLAIYGACPDDPVIFPWWFACVFPVSESEKYRLLGTSSVRARLKICHRWITEWESNRWRLSDCLVM